jgi:hypothetical protein
MGWFAMRVARISGHWEFGFLVILALGYLAGIYDILRLLGKKYV